MRDCIPIRGMRIGGSVVECSPATRAARVRFPANATFVTRLSKTVVEKDLKLNIFPEQWCGCGID